MSADRHAPGYMTEDLELRVVSGPPAYAARTSKPVEHITLKRTAGEVMGYIYFNDDDDAAGWVAQAGASPEAWNDAAFWTRILRESKASGLKPTEALRELFAATNSRSHIVPGSRSTSPSLAALKAIAGVPQDNA